MGRTVARAADTSGSSPFAASRQVSEPKTARVGPTGSSRCSQASPSHGTPEDHAIALSWFPPSRGHQVHFWLGSAGSVGPVADPGARRRSALLVGRLRARRLLTCRGSAGHERLASGHDETSRRGPERPSGRCKLRVLLLGHVSSPSARNRSPPHGSERSRFLHVQWIEWRPANGRHHVVSGLQRAKSSAATRL